MAAENYHLKWNSHLSYLNTSIATLYKNEKFAYVMLYSSYSNIGINSDIPTVGISAHKFILCSCSQFFATMFETAPITASNGVLYIVLPPDLSHRAIQILVQYLYSGEATVSNDILNEVSVSWRKRFVSGNARRWAWSTNGAYVGSVPVSKLLPMSTSRMMDRIMTADGSGTRTDHAAAFPQFFDHQTGANRLVEQFNGSIAER